MSEEKWFWGMYVAGECAEEFRRNFWERLGVAVRLTDRYTHAHTQRQLVTGYTIISAS